MEEKRIKAWVGDNYYMISTTMQQHKEYGTCYVVHWKTGDIWLTWVRPLAGGLSKREGIAAVARANSMGESLGGWTKIAGPYLEPYYIRNLTAGICEVWKDAQER